MSKGMDKTQLIKFLKELGSRADNMRKSWGYDLFRISCEKCGHDRVWIVNGIQHEYDGCPTCGYDFMRGHCIIKCQKCGNAMTLLTSDDIEEDYYDKLEEEH